MRISIFACVLCVLGFAVSGWSLPQSGQSRSPLEVTLSADKSVYRAGETIELRIEIRNRGPNTLFVGNEILRFMDWIYFLKLIVMDENGALSPFRGLPIPFTESYNPKEKFSDAVVKSWVALPSGYFFGTTMPIDGETFKFLKKPGSYKLYGTYHSHGMEADYNFNRLAASPKEIKALPFRSWQGAVDTNTVLIEILPAKNSN